ncbi:MAG: hypothetical protein H6835_08290 [Planctomycetes bacterium]|nr:hypothetical protein [Planctomycetota bacterium]
MFLTRHFVFVHVPKTGGNFVREILERHAPASWQLQALEAHATWREIPMSHRALPRLAFARNPFSWYVSWFHFQQKEAHSEFFLRISDQGRLDFQATMRNALTGEGLLSPGYGALTQTLFDMLGEGLEGARVGKMEQMRADMLRLFGECVEVPAAMAEAIRELPPQNTSSHRHYSRYYDPELRRLVRDKDAPVFDYFGYEWEEPPA